MQVDFDEKYFPSDDYKKRFLKRYLEEYHKIEGIELSEGEFAIELDDLFHRVSLVIMAHILKWCIFAHVYDVNEDVSGR